MVLVFEEFTGVGIHRIVYRRGANSLTAATPWVEKVKRGGGIIWEAHLFVAAVSVKTCEMILNDVRQLRVKTLFL